MPAIHAFTAPQVRRLTRLSARRLAYWDETGVYGPTYKDERPRHAYRRVYTFQDVVSLRALAILRDEYGVSLEELRRTGQYLARFTDTPWTLRFWVRDGRVIFHHPDSDLLVDRIGQRSFVDLAEIWASVEAETDEWSKRDPADIGRVARHRHVQRNRWVIKGTRVPTSAIWSFHRAGYDTAGIMRQYPSLHAEDIAAAIAHECAQQASPAA